MSKYSGKCDCYDTLLMIHNYTDEELRNNVKIYIGDNKNPLHIESSKDLIQYYPYLVSSAGFDNKNRTATVYLTSESYVDKEERDRLELYLNQILKIYNRCKRKKVEFNIQDIVNEVCYVNLYKDTVLELAKRVKEKGKNATIDGLHLEMHELYRSILVDEMIKNGVNPREYGYERFLSEENNT